MLKIVFATTSATVSIAPGNHTTILAGEHWPASDPIVRDHPDLFTDDPRHGLRVSEPLAEDDEELTVEQATAAVEVAQKNLDEAKERTGARQSQAPVEQATKAPGEKRTTRRG